MQTFGPGLIQVSKTRKEKKDDGSLLGVYHTAEPWNPFALDGEEIRLGGELDMHPASNTPPGQNFISTWTMLPVNRHDPLTVSFSCLAMMETGFDIDTGLLSGVMAMSHGNSIYVRSDMIRDPHENATNVGICRVFGNLGRSEMAFLVPPPSPKLEEYDINSWHLVNHLPFDGRFEDKFQGTSLHLSFTGFELPVDVGARGLRDTLVTLIESVVSANDGPKHIGDLDINVPKSDRLLFTAPKCNHNGATIPGIGKELVSIDSWAEFWERPEGTGVFRASGNWQARFAAAAASLQLGKRAAILPPSPCLECLEALDTSRFDLIIA